MALKLNPNRKYALLVKWVGGQPYALEDLQAVKPLAADGVKGVMHFIVSCAADEHYENPDVRLEYLKLVSYNKRPGRKVLVEVSRNAMSPEELKRAFGIIMSWI